MLNPTRLRTNRWSMRRRAAAVTSSADIARVYAWAHRAPGSTNEEAATATPARHPALTIALHWGSVLVLVVAVGAMLLRDVTEDDGQRALLLQVHQQLSLLLLAAVLWRIGRRLLGGLVNHAPGMARLLRWAAAATHVGLYAVLLALPLLGWALTSAHGMKLNFLGVLPLPALTGADSEFADTLSDYHVWMAWVLLALAGAHAAAALWHHLVRRDEVLSAMLPARWLRARRAPRPAQAGTTDQVWSG